LVRRLSTRRTDSPVPARRATAIARIGLRNRLTIIERVWTHRWATRIRFAGKPLPVGGRLRTLAGSPAQRPPDPPSSRRRRPKRTPRWGRAVRHEFNSSFRAGFDDFREARVGSGGRAPALRGRINRDRTTTMKLHRPRQTVLRRPRTNRGGDGGAAAIGFRRGPTKLRRANGGRRKNPTEADRGVASQTGRVRGGARRRDDCTLHGPRSRRPRDHLRLIAAGGGVFLWSCSRFLVCFFCFFFGGGGGGGWGGVVFFVCVFSSSFFFLGGGGGGGGGGGRGVFSQAFLGVGGGGGVGVLGGGGLGGVSWGGGLAQLWNGTL